MSTPTRAAQRRELRERARPARPRPAPLATTGGAPKLNIRHMMVSVPASKLPFKGMVLGEGQVARSCVCSAGWLTICPEVEAEERFREHIAQARAERPPSALRLVDPQATQPGGRSMATITGSYTISVETDNEHTVEEMAAAVAAEAIGGIEAAARIYDYVTVVTNDNAVMA